MNRKEQLDERIQKCLNPKCGAILFVSGEMATDTEDRGIDRDLHFKHDEKGEIRGQVFTFDIQTIIH
jgi:hypothetical protein